MCTHSHITHGGDSDVSKVFFSGYKGKKLDITTECILYSGRFLINRINMR